MLEKSDDPYKALLSCRNTPLDRVNLSPFLLKHQLYEPEEVLPKVKERQRKQKVHHDRQHAWTRCAVARFLSEGTLAPKFVKFMKQS